MKYDFNINQKKVLQLKLLYSNNSSTCEYIPTMNLQNKAIKFQFLRRCFKYHIIKLFVTRVLG